LICHELSANQLKIIKTAEMLSAVILFHYLCSDYEQILQTENENSL